MLSSTAVVRALAIATAFVQPSTGNVVQGRKTQSKSPKLLFITAVLATVIGLICTQLVRVAVNPRQNGPGARFYFTYFQL